MKVRNYLKGQKGKSEYFSANDYRYLADTLIECLIPFQDDMNKSDLNDDESWRVHYPSINAMKHLCEAFKDILRDNPEFESAITNIADYIWSFKRNPRGIRSWYEFLQHV